MRKLSILLAGLFLWAGQTALAGEVDSLFIDARGSFRASVNSSDVRTVLAPEYLNVHIFGTINEHFSYRVRQRLNVPIDSSNPFKATDWMCLNW